MAAELQNEIARKVDSDIQTYSWQILPGMQDLMERYGISRRQIAAALHDLQATGRILLSERKRARVVHADPHLGVAEEALYRHIKGKIASGVFRIGSFLPKVAYFTFEFCVSNKTVQAAYRRLIRDGLLVRQGRKWLVRPMQCRVRQSWSTRPAVFILLTKSDDWGALYRERTLNFPTEFLAEADRSLIRIVPVFTNRVTAPAGASACGLAEIENLARSIGGAYLGVLAPLSRRQLPALDDWCARLTGLGRPVVWFDRYDDPEPMHICTSASSLVRCKFSESAGISAALEAIVSAGHRRIVFPCMRNLDWNVRRLHDLRIWNRSNGQPLTIEEAPNCDEHWEEGIRMLPSTLEQLRQTGSQHVKNAINAYLHDAPDLQRQAATLPSKSSFVRVLQATTGRIGPWLVYGETVYAALADPFFAKHVMARSPDAVIVPNDEYMRLFYLWTQVRGFSIPRDLSILSFDNNPRFRLIPVNTVDFGFRGLAYRAFHILTGSIELPRGDIVAEPFVVDRGSIRTEPQTKPAT